MSNHIAGSVTLPPARFGAWGQTCSELAVAVAAGPGVVALVGPEGSGKTYTLMDLAHAMPGRRAKLRIARDPMVSGVQVDLIDDVGAEQWALLDAEPAYSGVRVQAMRPNMLASVLGRYPDAKVVRMHPMRGEDVRMMVETRRQQIGLHGDAFTPEALSCLDRLADGSPRRLDRLIGRAERAARAGGSRAISGEHVEQAGRDMAAVDPPATALFEDSSLVAHSADPAIVIDNATLCSRGSGHVKALGRPVSPPQAPASPAPALARSLLIGAAADVPGFCSTAPALPAAGLMVGGARTSETVLPASLSEVSTPAGRHGTTTMLSAKADAAAETAAPPGRPAVVEDPASAKPKPSCSSLLFMPFPPEELARLDTGVLRKRPWRMAAIAAGSLGVAALALILPSSALVSARHLAVRSAVAVEHYASALAASHRLGQGSGEMAQKEPQPGSAQSVSEAQTDAVDPCAACAALTSPVEAPAQPAAASALARDVDGPEPPQLEEGTDSRTAASDGLAGIIPRLRSREAMLPREDAVAGEPAALDAPRRVGGPAEAARVLALARTMVSIGQLDDARQLFNVSSDMGSVEAAAAVAVLWPAMSASPVN